MARITFHRNHKIKDCIGYADYISNPSRHSKKGEELAHFGDGTFATYSNIPIDHLEFWKKVQVESLNSKYSAHASIIYIPQEIQDKYRAGDDDILKDFIKQYASDFEKRYPGILFELAVHDNDNNMHLHRMDCERLVIDLNRKPEITTTKSRARYKVDGKQTTKKKYLLAIENGNTNVEKVDAHETVTINNPCFGAKETFFKSRDFGRIEQKALANLYNSLPYVNHDWGDTLEEGYLAQRHVPKGDPNKYSGIASDIEYNKYVKEHNATLDQIKQAQKEYDDIQAELDKLLDELEQEKDQEQTMESIFVSQEEYNQFNEDLLNGYWYEKAVSYNNPKEKDFYHKPKIAKMIEPLFNEFKEKWGKIFDDIKSATLDTITSVIDNILNTAMIDTKVKRESHMDQITEQSKKTNQSKKSKDKSRLSKEER